MMKQFLRLVRGWLLLFLGLTVLFTGLMVAAYAIPNRWIAQNAAFSRKVLAKENGNAPSRRGYYQTRFYAGAGMKYRLRDDHVILMDSFTDDLMLEMATAEEGTSLLRRAMVPIYARYWHGYQVALRPLLAVVHLPMIRWLLGMLQLALLAAALSLVNKRLGTGNAVIYAITLAAVGFLYVPFSLQYSSMFITMQLAVIAALHFCQKPWFARRMPYGFFIVGAFTVFLDLLTTPLLTLGVPLVFLLLVRLRTEKDAPAPSLWQNFLFMIKGGVAWAAGYVGLWLAKWGIASLVLHRNQFRDGLDRIFLRVSNDRAKDAAPALGRFDALGENARVFMHTRLLIALAVVLAAVLLLCLLRREARRRALQALPVFSLALLPYAWYLAVLNHSYVHYWFTYRNQLIALLALLCALFYCVSAAIPKLKRRSSHG
ncbi:MAG: hypothetical protein LBS96_10095 [Oscillospiraceae bacterium]|jgi:hypothetical protein|nr:hypothetical protein [Oscillospiraceae bacterium]